MSETDASAPRRLSLTINGEAAEVIEADFGSGRTVQVQRLSMGRQFDLAEHIPDAAGSLWRTMALLAASVVAIDGVPVPPSLAKASLRQILDRLGDAGVAAANRALDTAMPAPEDAEAAHRAQVGNSPALAASAS